MWEVYDLVNVNILLGKNVVAEDARLVGAVTGVEVELMPKWEVTHLHVSLTEETTRELGYKKPFLGSVDVVLPISIVKAVGDVISLDKKIDGLRDLVEPSKN
jgi:sporulation protein YlmC with PRC-barrel domain